MQPRIEFLNEKTLVGEKVSMSFSDDNTSDLWRKFAPRIKEIKNTIGPDLYSVEIYPKGFFQEFNSKAVFEKWAAIEVTNIDSIPTGMAALTITSGLYAVFLHRGSASQGAITYQFIFNTWLPNSGFYLDDRPHFALMGKKYIHEDPGSEEEIWIPIRMMSENSGIRV